MRRCGYVRKLRRGRLSNRVYFVAFVLMLWIFGGIVASQAASAAVHSGGRISPDSKLPQESVGTAGKITVISIPYLSFLELEGDGLQALPGFGRLVSAGQWAAMNVRLPFKGIESVYATWGAGQVTDARGAEAWNTTEQREGRSAAALLERYAGLPMDKESISVVVPSIESIRRVNEAGDYLSVPGQLGTQLKKRGIRVGVWGSLDTPKSGHDRYRRTAPLMVMDEHGIVQHGTVDGTLLAEDGTMPYGVRTRYDWLLSEWKRQSGSEAAGTLSVIELGDLYRLYSEKQHYRPEAFLQLKKEVLVRIDRFVGQLMREMEASAQSEVLWVISPQAHTDAQAEKRLLTPVVRWAADAPAKSGSLLSSATTRRAGVVAAIDVAPSILQEFHVPIPRSMIGRPFEIGGRTQEKDADSTLSVLLTDVKLMSKVYVLRPSVLYGLCGFEVTAMLLGLFAAWRGSWFSGWAGITRGMLLSVLLLPALLLALGWLIRWDEAGLVALLLAGLAIGGVGAAFYATRMIRLIRVFWLIGIGTSILILCDGLTGAAAMKHSVLGYDAMIGARYYGIGNEFMGVLLGAAVLGLSAWLQARAERAGAPPRAPCPWRSSAPAVVAGAGIVGYLAAPALGTNAGGALAAAAAFGALAARLASSGALRWRRLALALALPMAAALAGLWLLNGAWTTGGAGGPGSAAAASASVADAIGSGGASGGHGSHIGRAFEALHQGRFDVIGAMIARKLAMNLHLIRVSAWSKVLLTGLAVMALLVLRPSGRLRRWEERYPYLMHGCYANVIGTIVALALNDSGIVAAATMIVYSAVPLILLSLGVFERGGEPFSAS